MNCNFYKTYDNNNENKVDCQSSLYLKALKNQEKILFLATSVYKTKNELLKNNLLKKLIA